VYIGMLRQKLEINPSDPQMILTEPGVGYRLWCPRPPETDIESGSPSYRLGIG
jgi:hypothetical protein